MKIQPIPINSKLFFKFNKISCRLLLDRKDWSVEMVHLAVRIVIAGVRVAHRITDSAAVELGERVEIDYELVAVLRLYLPIDYRVSLRHVYQSLSPCRELVFQQTHHRKLAHQLFRGQSPVNRVVFVIDDRGLGCTVDVRELRLVFYARR